MTGSMIERIAETLCEERRRIWNEHYPDDADDRGWNMENETFREQLRREARAVVAAMREPTDAMINAGAIYQANGRSAVTNAQGTWAAMIIAALKD
jgi:hypothetical protein